MSEATEYDSKCRVRMRSDKYSSIILDEINNDSSERNESKFEKLQYRW